MKIYFPFDKKINTSLITCNRTLIENKNFYNKTVISTDPFRNYMYEFQITNQSLIFYGDTFLKDIF